MNADTNIAIMLPPPANPAQMPIALALSSGGKLDVMIDSVTGMIIAAPTPATTRATIITSSSSPASDPMVATPNTARPESSTGLAAVPVTDRPDRQQQRGQGDRVGVDDPQHVALRGAEVDGHLLLGDVQAGHRGEHGDERRDHRDHDVALGALVERRACRRQAALGGCALTELLRTVGTYETKQYRSVCMTATSAAGLSAAEQDPRVARSRTRMLAAATELLVEDGRARRDRRCRRRAVRRGQVDAVPALGLGARAAARRDARQRARRPRRSISTRVRGGAALVDRPGDRRPLGARLGAHPAGAARAAHPLPGDGRAARRRLRRTTSPRWRRSSSSAPPRAASRPASIPARSPTP